jgi:lipopolysaccharide export system protein LptC
MSELAIRDRTARQVWARPGGRHDVVVRWVRRILPLGIGALLAVLVVSPLVGKAGDISFVLAKDTVDMAKERLRVVAATYRGQDSAGRPFILTAGSAVQATSREPIVKITDVTARLDMAEGPATIQAKNAVYDMEKEVVSVVGPVTFQSADGYKLDMNNVSIGLKTRKVTSNGAVAGQLPKGSVTGGAMQADINARQVAISGGVTAQLPQGRVSGGAMTGDIRARQFGITGGVSGNTPLGSFAGSQMSADLATKRVSVTGGVSGKTRYGTYSANEMYVDQNARTLVLQGRARLIVYPRGLR